MVERQPQMVEQQVEALLTTCVLLAPQIVIAPVLQSYLDISAHAAVASTSMETSSVAAKVLARTSDHAPVKMLSRHVAITTLASQNAAADHSQR